MSAVGLSYRAGNAVRDAATGRLDALDRSLPSIEAIGVGRVFRGRMALDDVSLRVHPGEIHALLGPNGAGKTTLLRIVAGLTAPSSGRLSILGTECAPGSTHRSLVGVVPAGSRSFYQRVSGLENLVFFARLHGLRRRVAEREARAQLERVGLLEHADTRVGEYSQGMQKRLAIARALLPRPLVLLVDEATHDLDPPGAHAIRQLVDGLRADGSAVIWATQRVDEIQGFADGVTLLQDGRLRFAGTVPELLAHGRRTAYVVELRLPPEEEEESRLDLLGWALGDSATAAPAVGEGEGVYTLTPAEGSDLGRALGRLLDVGIDIVSCRHERHGVERAFLALTEQTA